MPISEKHREYNEDNQRLSRRMFLKLAALGVLAGCGPKSTPSPTPTRSPTITPLPPTVTSAPTAKPEATAISPPTETPSPTQAATIRPTPATVALEKGKVTHVHHTGVWDGDTLLPNALYTMLDAAITQLTGLNDAREAWAALFKPQEQVAIKVNVIGSSAFSTHLPLVIAVTKQLQAVGIPAEHIVIFDRSTRELEGARYPVNEDGEGIRCYGTDRRYTGGWSMMGTDIQFSDILLNCDALINIPVLKAHSISGISFAMKNHYGTFDRPGQFHAPRIEHALAELNALPPIRERTRLIIGDALTVCTRNWNAAAQGDSILMSFDPVAHDAIGLQRYQEVVEAEGGNATAAAAAAAAAAQNRAMPWLTYGSEVELGVHDVDHIDVVEANLG